MIPILDAGRLYRLRATAVLVRIRYMSSHNFKIFYLILFFTPIPVLLLHVVMILFPPNIEYIAQLAHLISDIYMVCNKAFATNNLNILQYYASLLVISDEFADRA